MEPYFSNAFTPAGTPPHVQTRHRLFVDNRDRDAASTGPFDFTVSFNSCGIPPYNNVSTVELKGLSFPKVSGESYIVMSIDQLNDNQLDATAVGINSLYAVAYFDNDALAAGAIKPIKGADFYLKQVSFNPPLGRLDRLSVKFMKHDGSTISLSDTANVANVSMLFEVTSGRRAT